MSVNCFVLIGKFFKNVWDDIFMKKYLQLTCNLLEP